MEDAVIVERDGPIATVRLNRPEKRHALNRALWTALGDAMDELLGAPGALERLIRYTAPFDHSGSPTISLPCGFTEAGLPLGFQLIGPHLGEGLLLRAGRAFERATVWNARHPDL